MQNQREHILTSLYMEVNSTEPFPSVRVPCILINLFAKGKGDDPLSLTSAESSLEIGEIPLSFDKFKGLSVFLYVY